MTIRNVRERRDVMLAYPFDEKRLKRYIKPWIVQPKVEGNRCRAEIDAVGDVTLYSSSARVITSVPHINQALKESGLKNIELDGELYVHGMPHQELSSRVSPTVSRHPDYENVEYHVFDIIDMDTLGVPPDQRVRCELIRHLSLPTVVQPVDYYLAETLDQVEGWYNQFLSDGYEGIIIRNGVTPYERRRTTNVMKLKPRLSGVYTVVDYEEESDIHGRAKNALGALVLKDLPGPETCTEVTFKVGTGFSRLLRQDLWALRSDLKGKRVKIRYQSCTLDGKPKMASFESFVEG